MMTKLYNVLNVIPEMQNVIVESGDDRSLGNHRQKNWINCTTKKFLETLVVVSIDVVYGNTIRIILADTYDQRLHNLARWSNEEAIAEAFGCN